MQIPYKFVWRRHAKAPSAENASVRKCLLKMPLWRHSDRCRCAAPLGLAPPDRATRLLAAWPGYERRLFRPPHLYFAGHWRPNCGGLEALMAYSWERCHCAIQKLTKEGYLPQQWRQVKIIPLNKLDKPDYAVTKAWRPISLLLTLSKIIEAVLAKRLLYLLENYNLLP
jgi:hypothetical protein